MTSPIEAVFFDADQTLWDFQLVMGRALLAVLGEMQAARPGPATAGLTVAALTADRTAVVEDHPGELNLVKLRRLGFERTIRRLRLADDGLAEIVTASYFAHRDAEPELFADTLTCLDALRGHYRLGVLSNGSRLPARCGLDGHFEVVVFAQHHGSAKPDPTLFATAAGLLGLDGEQCVLVGDHPVNDVFGAKNAGWHAVWLDRQGDGTWDDHTPAVDGARPDAVITGLDQLPGILNEMGGRP